MRLSISTKCGASRNWHVHRGGKAHPTRMAHRAPPQGIPTLPSRGLFRSESRSVHAKLRCDPPQLSAERRTRGRRMKPGVRTAPGIVAGLARGWDFRYRSTAVMLISFTSGADGAGAPGLASPGPSQAGGGVPRRPANERCHPYTRGHRAGRPDSGRSAPPAGLR